MKDFLVNLQWEVSRRQLHTSKIVSNNCLKEILDAICTISNSKWTVMGAYLNFRTEKSEKTPLVLHGFDVPSINILIKKVHLWLLKSNLTNSILKLPWKKFHQRLLYCIYKNKTFTVCKKCYLSYLNHIDVFLR